MDNYFSRYVQLALSGDNSAFETLYNLTKDQVYFVALNITKNEEDAFNIMQDSYINAFENLSMLNAPEYFDLWLNRIVSNTVKAFIKENRPELFNDTGDYNIDEWDENENRENLSQESVDDKETRRLICDIVDNLPYDQKLMVMMHYYQEMNISTIASTLELSEICIKYSIMTARKTIKENIKKLESDGMLLRTVTISAVPFVLTEEAKSQFFFHPAPSFDNVISIASENDEEISDLNTETYTDQFETQAQVPQSYSVVDTEILITEPFSSQVPTETIPQLQQSMTQPIEEPEENFVSDYGESSEFNEVKSTPLEYEETLNFTEQAATQNDHEGYRAKEQTILTEFSEDNSPKFTQPHTKTANMASSHSGISSFMSTTVGKAVAAIIALAVIGIGITVAVIIAAQKGSISSQTDNVSGSAYSGSDDSDGFLDQSNELTEEEIQKKDIENYSYNKNSDGTLTITQYNGKLDNIVIPDEIGGKRVTSIGYHAFKNGSHIKSITISKYINNIWTGAGNSINNPFIECIYLEDIYVDSDNTDFYAENGVLYNKNKTRLFAYPSGKIDKSFTVPKTVESIYFQAFSENMLLEKVSIPSGVTSIGQAAFSNCSSLKEITIPKGVSTIPEQTFMNCSSLTSVSLPETLESIGELAFNGCTSLESIEMPKSLKFIKSGAFMECTMLETIIIPNPQTVLDEGDVDNLKYKTGTFYLTSVTIKAPKGSKAEQYAKKCKVSFEAL